MQILILGAGGFIGSHLVEHLLERGEHSITGLDITDEKLAGIDGPAFTFVKADVRDFPEELIREAEVVIDLISYANPSIYVESPLDVFELNFTTNLAVVDACVRFEKRLIQYSTSEVYGKLAGTDMYREDASDLVMGPVAKQRWIYASAKQLLERVIHAHGLQGDLQYTVLRPFNFIGPRIDYLVPAGTMGGPRVFAHFVSALLHGGPMQLVDGGEAHRTFLSIDEANTAFQTLLDHPQALNQVFNVGNPNNDATIRGLAHLMRELYEELTGRTTSCAVVEVSGEKFYGPGYEDMDRVPPDISKLRALGWEPQRDLRTILAETMGHYLGAAGHVRASA